MRKIVSLILLCFLFLVCFIGCTDTKNNENEVSVELQKDDDLVLALIAYLQDIFVSHDMLPTSTAIKIDEIKNGKQALHVGFNKSSYYFVCAYYDNAHEYETIDYCCATNYTWVKFESANDISKRYEDGQFVVAFQVNKASFVTDITSKDANVPNMEHFQLYTPTFNNGINTNSPLVLDKTFVYLNSSDKSNVYHSTSAYDNAWITIPCIYLDEQYYIIKELYTVYPDGSRSDGNIISDFGKYYDTLVNIMDTTGYSVIDEKGRTNFYGLIKIDDFANCINE